MNSANYIRAMGMTGTALTGRPCHVKQMDISGQIAYHIRQGREDVIAIDFEHDFGCEEDETATLLYGLFTHEIMHAIRTDSSYKEQRLAEYPMVERSPRKDIWNIVEDPAIEYFAKWEVSDTLFRCLKKTILFLYNEAPEIQDCGDDAWLQFIASLVMFGDVGALKGRFTFPEALECFKKCAPIMLRAIEEPDARKRFELSQEIFEIAKPLWVEHYDNNLDAFSSVSDMLSELGVTESGGIGSPVSNDACNNKDTVEDDAMRRRKQTLKIFEESEPDSMDGNPGQDKPDVGGAGSADGAEDTGTNTGSENSNGSGGNVSYGEADGATTGTDSNAEKKKGSVVGSDSDGSGDVDSDTKTTGSKADSDGKTGSCNKQGSKSSPDSVLDVINGKLEELLKQFSDEIDIKAEIDDSLIQAIKRMVASAGREKTNTQRATRRDMDIDDLHLVVKSPYYKNSSIRVLQKSESYGDEYDELCLKRHSDIVNFRAQLKKILQNKYSDKEYSTSGKINVDRMCGRKLTARVFEKRKKPDDKSDLAIVLMVDQSGSMRKSMGAVKEVCTIIMEALSKFDIPVKLVGFTTADRNLDAEYYYYGKWANDRNTRMMIPGISAGGGTFLGHAIRYGGELLKKRPEKKKLFVIITDAEPQFYKYKSVDDAYSDCRYAVQDISKFAEVLGLGIYNSDDSMSVKAFRFIFGKNCLSVSKSSAIVTELPKIIGKLLKS